MVSIGSSFEKIEGWLGSFGMEVFASILHRSWIDAALGSTGRQTQRERKLTSPFIVWLLIAMGLYRNLSIENVLNRMGNLPGVGSLWKDGETPASSSVVEGRDRVGIQPLRMLLARLKEWVLQTYREQMSWKGMMVLALDGTTFKVPDTDQNLRSFGLPKASRGRAAFPQMRALFLVSTKLHVILEAIFAPYERAEFRMALTMLAKIPSGSLVLMDRAFNGWQLLLGLQDGGSHLLVRIRRCMHGRPIQKLGRGDRLVEVKIPSALRRLHPLLPQHVVVRELTVRIGRRWYRFWTSLLDPVVYPAEDLVVLYSERWEEEVELDEIKTHQGGATTVNRPLIFRCTTPRRVLQEAYGVALAHNLVRLLMVQAANRVGVSPLRISFVGSLERIRSAALLMAAASTNALPAIFRDMIRHIGQCLLPERRKRHNPREVCVKMSAYKLKVKRGA
jgi:hypothetical protein